MIWMKEIWEEMFYSRKVDVRIGGADESFSLDKINAA